MFGRAPAFLVAASVPTRIANFPHVFIRDTVFCVVTISETCQYHHAAMYVRIYAGPSHLVHDDAILTTRIAQEHHMDVH